MRHVLILSVAAVAMLLAVPAVGQVPQQPKPVTRAQFNAQLDAAFAAMDTNHDGSLSLAELQAAQQSDLQKAQAALRAKLDAEFKRLDTNHDGQLSLQEFEASVSLHANATAQQILQQFDTNHDGKVTAAEFKVPRLRQFDAADTNHDGVVTPAEAAAAGKK